MFGKEFFLSDKKSHESRFPARFKNEIGRIYLSRTDQGAPFCVALQDNVRSPQINFCVGPDIHFLSYPVSEKELRYLFRQYPQHSSFFPDWPLPVAICALEALYAVYVDCPAVSKNQITQLIGLTEKLKWSCDGQNNFDLIRGISVIIRTFKEDFERHGGNILPQKIRELTGQTLKNVSGFCLATGRFPKSDELKNKKTKSAIFPGRE